MFEIRERTPDDDDAIWQILAPIVRAGDVFALPRDLSRANARGGGAHVANAGYATHVAHRGRGTVGAMCAHSLEHARSLGFRAMQFNFVVSTNVRAVALWQKHGFSIAGTLPGAFDHPVLGAVDAYVMFRVL